MNPPDPKRDSIEQLDHDVRGMRMEIEQLGRMLYEEVGKSRAIKARVWRQVLFNRVIIVLIATLFLLVTCQHAKSFFGGRFMGYSTGKDVFYGVCHLKPTLLECTNCCLMYAAGLPPEEQEVCVDLCIEKHSAGSKSGSFAAMSALAEAGNIVKERDQTQIVRFNNAKRFIRACTRSTHERVRKLANGLCRELGIAEIASA